MANYDRGKVLLLYLFIEVQYLSIEQYSANKIVDHSTISREHFISNFSYAIKFIYHILNVSKSRPLSSQAHDICLKCMSNCIESTRKINI